MSCLNCGFILILISILMTKINITNGRSYDEKYRHGLQYGKYSSQLRPHNSLRHDHHYYSRKQKYHGLYDSRRYGKPRRFTMLDRVDDRLDNAAMHFFEKEQKLTTSNPSDVWQDNATSNSTFFTSIFMSNFITNKDESDKTTTNHINHKHKHERERNFGWDRSAFGDYEIELNADSKGYLRDFTTSKPSESIRQDTIYFDRLNSSVKSTSTTESFLHKARDSSRTVKLPLPNNVDELKKTVPKTLDPRDALLKHLEHVHQEGRCHTPRAKVIHVHEVHPHPSKLYSPPCTILHRCGADTGCCESLKEVCKPKNITKVELYFSTTFMGQRPKVEKLHFENHTECECRSRAEDLMPRDAEDSKSLSKNKINFGRGTGKWKNENCVCPSNFSPRYLHGGACICDCFDKQNDCLAMKKGKVYFPINDRFCIQQKICSFPSCEFGMYNSSYGRCPKKNVKYRQFVSSSRIT